MKIERINLKEKCVTINAENVMLDNSSFVNVSMQNILIDDANLSDIKIDGAQMGGALIKNIGMPSEDHPAYNPDLKHRPINFESCDMNESVFTNCDLTNVKLENCKIYGLTINGIAIDKLIAGL